MDNCYAIWAVIMNKETTAEFGDNATTPPVSSFFLPCECKPGGPGFHAIDPFAYDIVPARINGTLGILHYDPPVYGIATISDGDPILGFLVTITHKETVALLDRMKGAFGPDGFNFHTRVMTEAKDANGQPVKCWAYVVTDRVLAAYESIEQVPNGIWDEDKRLETLLEKLESEEDKPEEDTLD